MTEPLPPNQLATTRFPRIGEREPEPFDARTWRLAVDGRVAAPLSLSFDDLARLPHVVRTGTIHCVTRWSRPGTEFGGVPLAALLEQARPLPDARFVRFASGRGHDTTLPLDVARDDVLVADALGTPGGPVPLPPEHGGPVRSVVFARYLFKSVKWLRRIELLAQDRLGYWERTAGYHNGADPWREERYVARGVEPARLRALLAARDLSHQDLLSADLTGADLAGADLRGAALRNARLAGADLRGADLRGANLTNALLTGADLRGARIDGVDLDGADLRRADLREAAGVPAHLAATQFVSVPEPDPGDGARIEGLDWRRVPREGLVPSQERFLRDRGALEEDEAPL